MRTLAAVSNEDRVIEEGFHVLLYGPDGLLVVLTGDKHGVDVLEGILKLFDDLGTK